MHKRFTGIAAVAALIVLAAPVPSVATELDDDELLGYLDDPRFVVSETFVRPRPLVRETVVVEREPIILQPTIRETVIVDRRPIVEKRVVIDRRPVVRRTVVVDRRPIVRRTVVVDRRPVVEKTVIVQPPPRLRRPYGYAGLFRD
jgi:hypothetical protein